MNKEIVQAVRRMSLSIGMDRLPNIDREIRAFMDEHPQSGISSVSIKVLATSLKFKENEKAANAILMGLIPEADIDDLVVIFNKITEYSAEFLGICRRYAGVKRLRPAILAIFKKVGMSCEEAHIYANCSDESTVANLLRTLDTVDFKRTKKAIRGIPVGRNVHLLPELSEQGVRNLREICGSAVLEYLGGSPIHSSETVRVEFFKSLQTMQDVLDFLRVNQFISEKSNQLEIAESFGKKLAVLSKQEHFGQFVQDIHGVAAKMCRSPCLQRRHLGALLFFSAMPFIEKDALTLSLVYDMVHDKSHDIRSMASMHCDLIKLDDSVHISKLLSHQHGEIAGGAAFLRNSDPRAIIAILKRHMSDGLAMHGLMHCLNGMGQVPSEYSKLVDSLYATYRSCDSADGWRILKECCVFYHKNGREDVLMDTLLSTSHLGMVCLLRDLIDLADMDQDALADYVAKGVGKIKSKSINDRKSGGLSLYFTVLTRKRKNYPAVRQVLSELVVDGASGQVAIKIRRMQVPVLFHTMNVLIAVFDNSGREDIPFYMGLGLACLLHDSFSIRNCGCKLLGTIFRKVLSGQRSFDSLFLAFRGMRRTVRERLEEGIATENSLVVYYILFVYERTGNLQDCEMCLVRKCVELGGLVRLKAERILKPKPQHSSRPSVAIRFGALGEKEVLLKVLLLLGSADSIAANAARSYMQNRYGLPKVSSEYTAHLVLAMAKTQGHGAFIREKLEAMVCERHSLDWEDVCDDEDIGHLLELLDGLLPDATLHPSKP